MAQQNINFYDLLRVPPTATINEINQSYRKLAKEFHPDKNPAAGDIFKDISYAHGVLTDPGKRNLYDQYGVEGLQGGVHHESTVNLSDLFPHMSFGSFFDFPPGMGMFTNRPQFQRPVEDIVYKIGVTLEDLYHGRLIKYTVQKDHVCFTCHGKGSRSGMRQFCHRCLGTGHPIGSSILSLNRTCFNCGGEGFSIPSHDRCVACSGAKVFSVDVMVDVCVEKGMKDGESIVLPRQGHQAPGSEPGNIVFVLEEQQHDLYLRLGDDLFVNKEVNLTDALCGCCFPLQHLDGSILKVVLPPGSCIESGKNRALPFKGMPVRRQPGCCGTMYVTFKVEFPSNNFANESQLKLLEQVLGPRAAFTMPSADDVEEVELVDVDLKEDDYEPHQRTAYTRPMPNLFDPMEGDPRSCVPQ